jgi:hypothetical protein
MKQLPGLLKQERESLICIFLILFKAYRNHPENADRQKYLDSFIG